MTRDASDIMVGEVDGAAGSPLQGEALQEAHEALQQPDFLKKLTARIVKLAKDKGFRSPFSENPEIDLPGGKSAGDLAIEIIEKALNGNHTWNRAKHPDFYSHCLSRTESILSNWLNFQKRRRTTPLTQQDGDGGEIVPFSLQDQTDPYKTFAYNSDPNPGENLLMELALSYPDSSPEQAILTAVIDHSDKDTRSYCVQTLGMSEGDYDAARKRLRRKAPEHAKEWLKGKEVS